MPALRMALHLLGNGDTSRLKTRLKTVDPKTKRALALDGGMDGFIREDPGMMIAVGEFAEASQSDPVEAAIFDEIAKLGTSGPASDELRKAKNQIESGLVFSLENSQGLGEAIGRAWVFTGSPAAFVTEADDIEKVSAADVQRVVKKYFSPDRATVVVIPPKGR